jgi:hypothetical protein
MSSECTVKVVYRRDILTIVFIKFTYEILDLYASMWIYEANNRSCSLQVVDFDKHLVILEDQ